MIDSKSKPYSSFLNPPFLRDYMIIRRGHIYSNEHYGRTEKPLNEYTAWKVKDFVLKL